MLLFATLRYLKLKIPKKYKYLSPGSIRLQVPNKSVPVGRAGYNPIGFRCPVNPSDSQLVFFQSSGGFPFSWFIRLFVKSYLQVKDLQKYQENYGNQIEKCLKFPASLFFHKWKKKSSLPAVIRAYPLIKFEQKFQSTLLLEPPLVIET